MIKNNIRKLRRSQKLSQHELANILGIQQTRISGWELGKSEPSEDELEAVADYFDVSPAFVLGQTLERSDLLSDLYATKQFIAGDNEERELLQIFRFLNGYGKSHLLLTAQMLEKYYKG